MHQQPNDQTPRTKCLFKVSQERAHVRSSSPHVEVNTRAVHNSCRVEVRQSGQSDRHTPPAECGAEARKICEVDAAQGIKAQQEERRAVKRKTDRQTDRQRERERECVCVCVCVCVCEE